MQNKKWAPQQEKKIICIPPFRDGFFLALRIQLPFSWLWALNEGTLLGMELAQHATRLALIDHASALPPPARITRPVLPTSDIGSRFSRGCAAHACRKLSSAVGVAVRKLE